MSGPPRWLVSAAAPAAIYLFCAAAYVVGTGEGVLRPSRDNHYVHLASAWLEGRLHHGGNPPGTNDWACFDTRERGPCPNLRYRFRGADLERYRWYVSFPPLPAAVILPVVAVMGQRTPDRLVWALLAGLGPMALFLLLRDLRTRGQSKRRPIEDVGLTLLFAFGTVYHFVSVQGTVWFAAHVVATPLLVGFVGGTIRARQPFFAGLALALAFLCRPTTALLALAFAVTALDAARGPEALPPPDRGSILRRVLWFLRDVRWATAFGKVVPFALPLLAVGALAMWHNQARFDDPFEFGHRYLQIRWRPRIETWGLFNYHYVGRNLALFVASLPWLSAEAPHITISKHGLALWVTTPNLLWVLFPKRLTVTIVALFLGVVPVLAANLMYQNTGWVQFGYRFALDYMPLLFVLLSLGGRRFGGGFWTLALIAVAINTFGAVTFGRMEQFYDRDLTQQIYFQPD